MVCTEQNEDVAVKQFFGTDDRNKEDFTRELRNDHLFIAYNVTVE